MSDSYKVYASKDYVDNKIEESRVQPDWNQNDPTAADYVKNRTHYEGMTTVVFADNVTVETADGRESENPFTMDEIVEGQTYTITWDGTAYECVAYIAEGPNTPSLGNGELAGVSGGNGEPFFITVFEGATLVFANTGTHTVSISAVQEGIAKIDEKFIPDTIARKSDLEGIDGGVTSWNDLTDKPFGEMETRDVYLPETQSKSTEFEKTLTVGDACVVNWNGVEYECQVSSYSSSGALGIALIGNIGYVDPRSSDTGEPFSIEVYFDKTTNVLSNTIKAMYTAYGVPYVDGSATFSIYKKETTVHTIDPKFLPAGGSGGAVQYIITHDEKAGTVSANMTFDELKAAWQGGKCVIPVLQLYSNAELEGSLTFDTGVHVVMGTAYLMDSVEDNILPNSGIENLVYITFRFNLVGYGVAEGEAYRRVEYYLDSSNNLAI